MDQMFITPMAPLGSIGGIEDIWEREPEKSGSAGVSAFQTIFRNAINEVKTTTEDVTTQEFLLATGQIDDAHTVPAAAAKAQLSTDLLTALRNKALEAYNEVIRLNL